VIPDRALSLTVCKEQRTRNNGKSTLCMCVLRRAQREADPTAEVWDTALSIGAIIEGQVHARKEYGVLCDLAAHPDVVGLVMPEQVTPWRLSACSSD